MASATSVSMTGIRVKGSTIFYFYSCGQQKTNPMSKHFTVLPALRCLSPETLEKIKQFAGDDDTWALRHAGGVDDGYTPLDPTDAQSRLRLWGSGGADGLMGAPGLGFSGARQAAGAALTDTERVRFAVRCLWADCLSLFSQHGFFLVS
mgnify:CR=1 FL=1